MTKVGTEEFERLTPMMKQYYELKDIAKEAILFFRMGDFYEIFADDAELVAPRLELVLTAREKGGGNKVPFCGVPHHSAKNYWIKLLKLGFKVAIADQVEDPAQAKGLVKREIVQFYTPGCIDELEGLESDKANYLAAIYEEPKYKKWTICVCDISTGELRLGNVSTESELFSILGQFRPREIILRKFIEDDIKHKLSSIDDLNNLSYAYLSESLLRDKNEQKKLLKKVFSTDKLEVLPCGPVSGGLELVATVMRYLTELCVNQTQFLTISPLLDHDSMIIDNTARRDLELFETSRRRELKGSLFKEINKTRTPMGARLLRFALATPLVCKRSIKLRQTKVKELLQLETDIFSDLRSTLKATPDLERLSTRILNQKAHPLELIQIKYTLEKSLRIRQLLSSSKNVVLDSFTDIFKVFSLSEKPLSILEASMDEEPSALGSSLRVFTEGFDKELDELRSLALNGQDQINAYEKRLKEETDISSLKIKRHKTYGLLIEVTKANLSKVPSHFVRRQTMVNNERFSTAELIELDESLASSTEKAFHRESKLFSWLLVELEKFKSEFKFIAQALAEIDLFHSFAFKARESSYVCPSISLVGELKLLSSRHPVVESVVGRHKYIPNDISIVDGVRTLLITGPNMSGKSTVMRQTAISAILHQIGSYVPASEAVLPVFDRVFTRVGAADDLSRGQSTFMVEMSEAAEILRQASSKSLVILDEIGRGTSTEDGLAIASAILENIAKEIGAYSLFATHYHELSDLAEALDKVENVQIEVKESESGVEFTHRMIKGSSGSSYGIEVAKLAGVPDEVVERAEFYIKRPISKRVTSVSVNEQLPVVSKTQVTNSLGLEDADKNIETHTSDAEKDVIRRLLKQKISKTTPLQALNLIDRLQRELIKDDDLFLNLGQ